MKKPIAVLARMMAIVVCIATVSSCNDDDKDERSSLASIYTVKFEEQPVVKVQPTADESTTPSSFVFYVRHDAADSELSALVPTIEVTPGATISPESGKAQDFSGGKTVRYTVTSEDQSRKQDYDLVCKFAASDEAFVVTVTIEEEDIVAVQPVIAEDGKSAIFYTNPGTTDEEKKSLTPIFTFVGASITPESGKAQDFSKGEVVYTIKADDGTEVEFTLKCENALYEDALIEEISFESDMVVVKPMISGNDIYFGVPEDIDPSALTDLIPTLTLSKNASADFTPGFKLGEATEYVITAEDGETSNTYYIYCCKSKHYDFDNWTQQGSNSNPYDMEAQWFNANVGVSNSMAMVANKTYPLNRTTDTPSGSGFAAELKTLQLKPNKIGEAFGVPNLVAGNLYLGGFQLSSPTIASTKFGIPYERKPLKVAGMFKYIPGGPENYYDNYTNIGGIDDSFAMTALLYEVESREAAYGSYDINTGRYTGTDFGTTLTGNDMPDIQNNSSVVAIKQWFNTETTPDFSLFELELEYGREWSADKFYKFTMIFSSSKDGASFLGSDGSTLILDDIYVMYLEK